MKVEVTLVVAVDPEVWLEIYGTERQNIRGEVEDHVLECVRDCAAVDVGAFTDVSLA